MDTEERTALIKKNFIAMGIGLMEMSISWWWPIEKIKPLWKIDGLEHLQNAVQKGNGVIFLCAHFSTLELAGRCIGGLQPFDAIYRKQKNLLFNYFLKRGRLRGAERIIDRKDTRGMIRSLRQGRVIYFAADQDYGKKHSIFVPFFGVPAATIVSLLRLIKMTNASVIPSSHYRLASGQYQITLEPMLENFPTGNDQTDLLRINHLIEAMITTCPEQYLWIHRRFKTRPPGEPSFYEGL